MNKKEIIFFECTSVPRMEKDIPVNLLLLLCIFEVIMNKHDFLSV